MSTSLTYTEFVAFVQEHCDSDTTVARVKALIREATFGRTVEWSRFPIDYRASYDQTAGRYLVVMHNRIVGGQQSPTPSIVRGLLCSSQALFDAGCGAGMGDARNVAERARFCNVYTMMLMVTRNANKSSINESYARGYVAGWSSVTSGTMA
jgi:hypothetical protein